MWFARIGAVLKDMLRLLTGIGGRRWQTKGIGMFYGWALAMLGPLVINLFRFVGVTMVVNTFVLPSVMQLVVGPVTGLPPEWQAWIGLMRGDRAVTILFSAMALAIADRIRLRPANPSLWQ